MKNTVIIALVSTLVLIILFGAVGFRTYVMWRGDHYFGSIADVHGSEFTITDLHALTRTVVVSSSTPIVKGRAQHAILNVGDPVLIVGSIDDRGRIIAELVRIVNPPRGERPGERMNTPAAPPSNTVPVL